MNTLSGPIRWYREPESRAWKRLFNFAELLVIALSGLAIVVVMYLYGDGSALQTLLTLFTSIMAFASACLAPSFYQASAIRRWQIEFVILAMACGVALSALAAFAVLELQAIRT